MTSSFRDGDRDPGARRRVGGGREAPPLARRVDETHRRFGGGSPRRWAARWALGAEELTFKGLNMLFEETLHPRMLSIFEDPNT